MAFTTEVPANRAVPAPRHQLLMTRAAERCAMVKDHIAARGVTDVAVLRAMTHVTVSPFLRVAGLSA